MRRIGSGVLLGLAALAMFLVPSATVIEHGGPRWLALAVGALAFPVLPLGWHAIAEWRRKRRAPAKSTLTAWDRVLLRSALVAIIAIGGTFAAARGTMWSALRHHALWFTDWSDPDPVSDSTVVQRVPASAEVIVWLRPGHTRDFLPVALSGDAEIVLAMGKSEEMIAIAAKPEVLAQLDGLAKLDRAKLESVDAPSGMRIYATAGWRTAAGAPPPALLELLRHAPDTANAVVAARPTTVGASYHVSSFVGWAEVGDKVVFTADADAIDAKSADQLVEKVHHLVADVAGSDCGIRAFASALEPHLQHTGLHLHGSVKLDLDTVRDIPKCMASK